MRMRKLTLKAHAYIEYVADEVMEKAGVKGFNLFRNDENPFVYLLQLPDGMSEQLAVEVGNELFHALELLPKEKSLAAEELGDYCLIGRDEDSPKEETYHLLFNHPAMLEFKLDDPEMRFMVKNWSEAEEDEGEEEEAVQKLIDGIKAGRLKAKSSDGYLVLAGKFYDAIASGEKTVEYRDFTEYNLKRTIGLKTIRFNRGYVKDAPQMKWEVKKVMLQDAADNECDPQSIPNGFLPVRIAIYLGKQMA